VSVEEFFKEDFEKSLEKEIMVYAFYRVSIELEQPKWRIPCDSHEIVIYLIKTELILLS
jgi:hypothetical protein